MGAYIPHDWGETKRNCGPSLQHHLRFPAAYARLSLKKCQQCVVACPLMQGKPSTLELRDTRGTCWYKRGYSYSKGSRGNVDLTDSLQVGREKRRRGGILDRKSGVWVRRESHRQHQPGASLEEAWSARFCPWLLEDHRKVSWSLGNPIFSFHTLAYPPRKAAGQPSEIMDGKSVSATLKPWADRISHCFMTIFHYKGNRCI